MPKSVIQTRISPCGNELSTAEFGSRHSESIRTTWSSSITADTAQYSPTYGTYTLPSGDGGQPGLFLSQIRAAIAQKRPRLGVVVLDCCSNLRPLPGEPRASAPFAQHRSDFSPLFKELFFSRPGTLSITSSKPYEYSIIMPTIRSPQGEQHFGALFTKLFSWEMVEGKEDPLGWDDLLGKVQRNLDHEFAQICKRGVIPLGNGQYVAQARQTIDYRW